MQVGFRSPGVVLPVRPGGKIPCKSGHESVRAVMRVQVWWRKQGLAGLTRIAGVVADSKPQRILLGETHAEIAGQGPVEKVVIDALACRLEVRSRRGVVEAADKSTQLGGAASGVERAAFGISNEQWRARRTTMGENLDRAGHRIGAGKSALRSVHDLNFVHSFESKVREIDGAAWLVGGNAIDEHLGEIGVASIEKERGHTARRAGLTEAEARQSFEKRGQFDGLPLRDFIVRDDIDGLTRRGGSYGLSFSTDHDARGKRLNPEPGMELANFASVQFQHLLEGLQRVVCNREPITARRNLEMKPAIVSGNALRLACG